VVKVNFLVYSPGWNPDWDVSEARHDGSALATVSGNLFAAPARKDRHDHNDVPFPAAPSGKPINCDAGANAVTDVDNDQVFLPGAPASILPLQRPGCRGTHRQCKAACGRPGKANCHQADCVDDDSISGATKPVSRP
jgi:hypothetical protein